MKPVTGQYECVHSSGVGLDYFTSRIDKLVLHPDGRFVLIVQSQSRAINAAQALIKGQQPTQATPETHYEGNYIVQGSQVEMHFDRGGFEQAILPNTEDGIKIGPNYFKKVSDATALPPIHRMKQDMDDIAKGIKIATTLGGMAVKAAKTIQGTIQAVQGTSTAPAAPGQQQPSPSTTYGQQQPASSAPSQQDGQYYNAPNTPPASQPAQPAQAPTYQPQQAANPLQAEAIFCDQCGARCRPGKRFCNNCGTRLP